MYRQLNFDNGAIIIIVFNFLILDLFIFHPCKKLSHRYNDKYINVHSPYIVLKFLYFSHFLLKTTRAFFF